MASYNNDLIMCVYKCNFQGNAYLVVRVFHLLQSNTYQGVIVTDDISSYAVFTYRCEYLDMLTPHGSVGFYISSTLFEEHHLSGEDTLHTIACENEPQSPWNNLVYRLAGTLITIITVL